MIKMDFILSESDLKSVSESNIPNGVGLVVLANVATRFLHVETVFYR